MQKLAIAAALTVVSLATLHEASAAELPAPPPRARPVYRPPPPPPPVFSWTGFYIGGNGGGGSFHNDFNGTQTGSVTNGFGTFPFTSSFGGTTGGIGGILGGQIGFNYEWPLSHWVIGVEADGDWSNLAGTNSGCSTITSGPLGIGSPGGCATVNSTLNGFETVRGRVGYAIDTGSYTFPSVLVYATGGGAWGQVNGNNVTTCLGPACPGASPPFTGGTATFNHGESGWTAGAGFEWAFFQHWTARIEYLHLQFPNGSTNFTTTTVNGAAPALGIPAGTGTSTTHISTNVGVDVVRFGVNYVFNFGGPAYAY
jgi:outer membrane immunogenic protein